MPGKCSMNAWRSTTAAILLLSFHSASAMIGEDAYVAFERDARGAALYANGSAAPLWLDANDERGVIRAAGDLQSDIARVVSDGEIGWNTLRGFGRTASRRPASIRSRCG